MTAVDDRPARTVRGSDYSRLARRVKDAGLLERRGGRYTFRITLTLALYAGVAAGVVLLGNSWWQLAAAVLFGAAFTQVAFLGHDGGHQQIFTSRKRNQVLSFLAGDLLVGISLGWWVAKHDRHHANPNKEDHDPDIGEGVLAFTTTQVANRTGGLGRWITRRQAWLFFPLLTLEGLNLHVAGASWLLRNRSKHRRGELLLMTAHWAGYLTLLFASMPAGKALAFAAVHQAVFGVYMGCSFAPNHKGMRIIGAEENVDYLRRQVLTARNIRGGAFTDVLLGGLNYQVEHHLFPSMPRASLRHAQTLVRDYCAEMGIPYVETTLLESYRQALGHLHEIGAPLRTVPLPAA